MRPSTSKSFPFSKNNVRRKWSGRKKRGYKFRAYFWAHMQIPAKSFDMVLLCPGRRVVRHGLPTIYPAGVLCNVGRFLPTNVPAICASSLGLRNFVDESRGTIPEARSPALYLLNRTCTTLVLFLIPPLPCLPACLQ